MNKSASCRDVLVAVYKGTVNDPTSFPTSSRVHGSHHWSFERLLSASLTPHTGTAFTTSPSVHPVLDGILGVSLVVHSHTNAVDSNRSWHGLYERM
ncbi:Succinate dehydrogenase [ubiquinone] cytochrome b small subunit [Mycena venus]|uniref:Succinate dehydrogenase [ubiquinone] cytochrome b small subunit n=1 Tax=Mycena venus TaxID=2733690 RepID=A0A8H6YVC9_9AGAR|nr:Succinate dehydrogenase [ubiquinone] cytochrome b small subunit [Mycena venus]